MADEDGESDVSTNLSPRIIFVRLGKDKSKDAIEDEIFKYVNKVLEESSDNGNVLEEANNCITLPDFAASRILQVAIGPEYVGLLLDNGRVQRFKCVTKNLDSTKKLWGSQRSADEPSFQVQSDEAYARQLQNEFLNNGASTSAVSGTSPAFKSYAIPSSSNNWNSRSLTRAGFDSRLVSNAIARTEQRFVPSSMPAAINTSPAPVARESQTTDVELERPSGTTSALVDSASRGTQANASVQTGSSVNIIDPDEGTSIEETPPSTSSATKASQEGKNDSNKFKVQDSANQRQENSVENLPGNGRSVSSSQSPSARRSVSSPTLLQRTVFTTNFPVMRQFSAPFLFPSGGVSFPLYSNSSTGQIIGSRGSLRLEPRVVRAQLAEAGAFPRTLPRPAPPRPLPGARQRGDRASDSNESKCASCSDAEFCYPEIGNVEWLEAENVCKVIIISLN